MADKSIASKVVLSINFSLNININSKIVLNEEYLMGEKSGPRHFEISKKRILSMLQVSEDSFLFGTENDGLFQLNAKGKLIRNYVYDKKDKKVCLCDNSSNFSF